MAEFHETRMGVRFYESQVPELITQLGRLAGAVNALVQQKDADTRATEQPPLDVVLAFQTAFELQLAADSPNAPGRALRNLVEAMGPQRQTDQNDIWYAIRKLVTQTARNVAQAMEAGR